MTRLLAILILLASSSACAADDPWAAWPYRLALRVASPELADATGMARVRVNLGAWAAKDLGDVRILDEKLREQPWRLVSVSAAGDADIVFHAVKGCRDYALIFGAEGKTRPDYGVPLRLGRTIIDDALPERAHTHGLWEWSTTPALAGAFSHTSPLLDRYGYHGTSGIGSQPIQEGDVLHAFVYVDPANPPDEIQMRIAFARKPDEGDWERKQYYIVYWSTGKAAIRGLSGTRMRVGDMPAAGRWQRLEVDLYELSRRAASRSREGGDSGYLYGISYCTDKGRAWWDLTTIGPAAAETDIAGFERSGSAKGAFVRQRLGAFTLARPDGARGAGEAGAGTVLTETRFIAAAGPGERVAWDFGDGATSTDRAPVHVFEGAEPRKVTLTVAGAAACEAEVGLKGAARPQAFAVELASCPFIVRAGDKALFNLRLEGGPVRALAVVARATLLDLAGRDLGRDEAPVMLLPGEKHPAFKAFSLDVSSKEVARVRFDMLYGGCVVATREARLAGSREALDALTIAGDRFLDASGAAVVVRSEVTPPEAAPRRRSGAPARVLVVGHPPVGELADRLRDAFTAAGTAVRSAGVSTGPAWSQPARQLMALSAEPIDEGTDVVLVASAWEMMLAGIPARVAGDAAAAWVDQIRRRSRADVVLLAPVAYKGMEEIARQYAVALRLVGVEKNVPVIDLYSRSIRLGDERGELLKPARVDAGFLVREIHPELVDMAVKAIVSELSNPAPAARTSE